MRTLLTLIIFLAIIISFTPSDAYATTCSFDFEPKSTTSGQTVTINLTKANSGLRYEARIGEGFASPQQTYSRTPLVFQLQAPQTGGNYNVTVTQVGFEFCAPDKSSTLAVNQPAPPPKEIQPSEPATSPPKTTTSPIAITKVDCDSFTNCLNGIQVPGLKAEFKAEGLIGTIISTIIPAALGIGGMLTVIFIIISGIQFITSGGDPKGAGAARSRLIYAVIGFIVLILAFAILQIIDKLFLRTGVA